MISHSSYSVKDWLMGKKSSWKKNVLFTQVYKFSKYTIDEQQDCYLRYGGDGGQISGIFSHSYFLIYYKGQRIYFIIEAEMQGRDEGKN